MNALRPALALLVCSALTGCMTAYMKSVGADHEEIYSRVYRADMELTWNACLEALKALPQGVSNRQAGYLDTKWVESSSAKSLTDAYGETDRFATAQYRFKVSLTPLRDSEGREVVKVVVQKDQVIQRDPLEGPRRTESDGVEENTLLYRIGRIIWIRQKIAQLEDAKVQEELSKNKGF